MSTEVSSVSHLRIEFSFDQPLCGAYSIAQNTESSIAMVHKTFEVLLMTSKIKITNQLRGNVECVEIVWKLQYLGTQVSN
jgi:hypothetical protein